MAKHFVNNPIGNNIVHFDSAPELRDRIAFLERELEKEKSKPAVIKEVIKTEMKTEIKEDSELLSKYNDALREIGRMKALLNKPVEAIRAEVIEKVKEIPVYVESKSYKIQAAAVGFSVGVSIMILAKYFLRF